METLKLLLLTSTLATGQAGSLLSSQPTFGGKQFWSDLFVHQDCRIQENVLTGHCRLLDESNRRRATGSFDECLLAFESQRNQLELSPLRPRVVLVLHGLGRSRQSMAGMVSYLRESTELSVLNVSYASTRRKIGDHARSLAQVVKHLPAEVSEVNFVAHSMGNLVIRHLMRDLRMNPGLLKEKRLGRFVMLAPPNRGAMLAKRFQDNPVFRVFWGTSGGEIANWKSLAPQLAIPACEFGIVAGGKGDAQGRNPLIAGDDDFVVAVDETFLPGASDFIVVPALHAVIMDSKHAQAATLRFLEHGYFMSGTERRPLARQSES